MNFEYAGAIQSWKIPITGTYKLEVWGAQGGTNRDAFPGGYGGYAYGEKNITKNTALYVGVGGGRR